MVEVDHELNSFEKKYIDGFLEGVGKLLGLSEVELQRLADTNRDKLVAQAKRQYERLREVVER
jgi:hypothetical protein